MTRATTLPIAFLLATVAACSSDAGNAGDTLAVAVDTPALTVPPAPAPGGALLDPNSASSADLAAIVGVGTAGATAIIAARPHANMVTVNALLPATLTEQQRDSVYTRLWKPINPNTATDAEILLIPGIGQRMLREFKEYRPWTSVEQFRREIGKYVDDAEVARLERYIVIQ